MQPVLLFPLSPTFTFSYSPSDLNECTDDSRKNEAVMKHKQVGNVNYDDEERKEEEDEFSFVCNIQYSSLIFAEDIFDNGQIRPVFPIFDPNLTLANGYPGGSSPQPPSLEKLSGQRHISSRSTSMASESAKLDGIPEGLELERFMKVTVENSLNKCKKSNSTGFSKLWRFRYMFRRSKSDGKDPFVIFNPSMSTSGAETKKMEVKSKKTNSGQRENKVKVSNGTKNKTTPSAQEKYYVMNKGKKENDKRRSYLPYKVGFFTNVIGISRNVHPL